MDSEQKDLMHSGVQSELLTKTQPKPATHSAMRFLH